MKDMCPVSCMCSLKKENPFPHVMFMDRDEWKVVCFFWRTGGHRSHKFERPCSSSRDENEREENDAKSNNALNDGSWNREIHLRFITSSSECFD